MRNINRMKIPFALVIAASILSSAAVYAGHHHGQEAHSSCEHGKKMGRHKGQLGMMKMFAHLDLSEQQRTDIKAMVKVHRQQAQDHRPSAEERQTHKAAMLAAITATEFNTASVRQLLADKKQRHEQAIVAKFELKNAIFKMLTPEQQTEFKKNFLAQSSGKCGHGRHR